MYKKQNLLTAVGVPLHSAQTQIKISETFVLKVAFTHLPWKGF